MSVNRVLEAAGGKWNRKAAGHIFSDDAAEVVDQIVLTGKVIDRKQELGDFPSPPAVVKRLVEKADITAGMLVLEPSAGSGNIAREVLRYTDRLHCFEIDETHCRELSQIAKSIHKADFLSIEPCAEYDRVVMNPPYAKQADIRHVLHAMKFLVPCGKLASVMSAGVAFRTNSLTTQFREIVDEIEPLPEGSFASSGTMVSTVIVTITNRQ
ncbi:MAG TPA: hypothetical protein VFW94_23660 [Candidatus Acidoferrales bacterium]|nr:hypothetical protein [Candidatus Acidoferrales bacterium]